MRSLISGQHERARVGRLLNIAASTLVSRELPKRLATHRSSANPQGTRRQSTSTQIHGELSQPRFSTKSTIAHQMEPATVVAQAMIYVATAIGKEAADDLTKNAWAK